MDSFKTTALTIITVPACLMLLLIPEPQQVETLIQPAPARQNQPVDFVQAEAIGRDQVVSIEIDQANQELTASIIEQTIDIPWVWYPELEQIVLTEELPIIEAIVELQPMLSNADPVIRLAAIESLGDMTDPATLPALAAALNDPSPQLRIAALEALGAQEHESAVSTIEPCLYDEDGKVRVAAIEALVALDSETAVPALAGLLSDPDARIRYYAVNALGEIGGEYAISYLLQARYDPDERIRANAEDILLELGS